MNATKTALENSEERYERVNLNLTQKTREARQLAENLKVFKNENEKFSEKIKSLQFVYQKKNIFSPPSSAF